MPVPQYQCGRYSDEKTASRPLTVTLGTRNKALLRHVVRCKSATSELLSVPQDDLASSWLTSGHMVISTLRIVPSPKHRSEVLEILRSVQGPTETQPGCLSYCIYEEEGPDQATLLCGRWETEAALREHIRSEFFRRLLVACELSTRPPEVCFHHVSATQGIELIQQLRGCGGEASPGDTAGANQITKETP